MDVSGHSLNAVVSFDLLGMRMVWTGWAVRIDDTELNLTKLDTYHYLREACFDTVSTKQSMQMLHSCFVNFTKLRATFFNFAQLLTRLDTFLVFLMPFNRIIIGWFSNKIGVLLVSVYLSNLRTIFRLSRFLEDAVVKLYDSFLNEVSNLYDNIVLRCP